MIDQKEPTVKIDRNAGLGKRIVSAVGGAVFGGVIGFVGSNLIYRIITIPLGIISVSLGGTSGGKSWAALGDSTSERIFLGILLALFGAFVGWMSASTKQLQVSSESASSGCPKCGCSDFEYDRYHDEYSCGKCGWLSNAKPNGNINVRERQ
jgi:ribosomal protein S27AE